MLNGTYGTSRGAAGYWSLALVLLAGASSVATADPAFNKTALMASVSHEPDPFSLDALEKKDAVIGDIHIFSGDVFDLTDPKEDGLFYRVVNALHIETRDDVIRRQLLVHSGDPFDADAVAETERLLRKNRFLQSAEVVPVVLDDGTVDLNVITDDTWSLTPSISFSRAGGHNTGGFEIEEQNLLGMGSRIKVGYKSRLERDETFFSYKDTQLGASRAELSFSMADNSDGSAATLLLQQPFYAMDARHAGGVFIDTFDQVDPLYQLGEVYDEVQHSSDRIELFYGWSDGLVNGNVSRWQVGLGYDRQQFLATDFAPVPGDIPADRRDVYPFVGYEWLQNRFEEAVNADNIQRVEDRFIGSRIAGRLGYASEALGSNDDAWLYSLEAQTGFKFRDDDTLLLHGRFDGRQSALGDDRYRFEVGAQYYLQQSPQRLLYMELRGIEGDGLDTNEQLALGGETGLRGYPTRYQTGKRQVLVTLEQRFYTDWFPFQLFHVGAAVFFDAGQSWDLDGPADVDLGLLRDVGIGLRIGSPRSSSGRMLHIDLAYPLDGPQDLRSAQFLVATSTSF